MGIIIDYTLDSDACVNSPSENCSGSVEYRSVPGGSSVVARCEHHFDQRMERYENSLERYADSDVAPSWFHAGWGGVGR